MRIEEYDAIREYRLNKKCLKFLAILGIAATAFLIYGSCSTIDTRNKLTASQESLKAAISELESQQQEIIDNLESEFSRSMPIPEPIQETTSTTSYQTAPALTTASEPPEYVISFTEDERILFEQIVAAEAHPAWDYEGYFLIAQTVMNQLRDGYYGATLKAVLTYKDNFSVYASGRYKQVPVTDMAKMAVEEVLQGTMPITLRDIGREQLESILYFCTKSQLTNHPSGFHAQQIKVTQYDNVVFFKPQK